MSTIQPVTTKTDINRHAGQRAELRGEYRAVPQPVRGKASGPLRYAVVVLADGSEVFLEVYGTPQAERSAEERERLDGRWVRVVGTVHRRMPVAGQGPLAPCVSNIEYLEAVSTAG